MIVDSHCHLDYLKEGPSIEEVLKNAKKQNIILMLNIATKLGEFEKIIETSNLYNVVYFTLGIHPHEANELTSDVVDIIYNNLTNNKLVGIGETGLDFHYNHSDKATQIISFEKQIEISQNSCLPMVIHMRNAEDDTLRVIKKKLKEKLFNGVIHCFTGSQKFADEVIDLGFYISASGVVTFKKSEELRNVFANIPDNKILVETDSPYLSPEPLRGKINQPAHITHTIKKLAEIRNCSYDQIVDLTRVNFFNLFSKINNI